MHLATSERVGLGSGRFRLIGLFSSAWLAKNRHFTHWRLDRDVSILGSQPFQWRTRAPHFTSTNIEQLNNRIAPFPRRIIDNRKHPAHRTVFVYEGELLSTDFDRSGLRLNGCRSHVT